MADTLTVPAHVQAMHDRVAVQYAASLAANTHLASKPRMFAAVKAQQAAYLAYLRAYAAKYPAEAHLLPDGWKGARLPEYRAFIEACSAVAHAQAGG
jgi:hypothetical protein